MSLEDELRRMQAIEEEKKKREMVLIGKMLTDTALYLHDKAEEEGMTLQEYRAHLSTPEGKEEILRRAMESEISNDPKPITTQFYQIHKQFQQGGTPNLPRKREQTNT